MKTPTNAWSALEHMRLYECAGAWIWLIRRFAICACGLPNPPLPMYSYADTQELTLVGAWVGSLGRALASTPPSEVDDELITARASSAGLQYKRVRCQDIHSQYFHGLLRIVGADNVCLH